MKRFRTISCSLLAIALFATAGFAQLTNSLTVGNADMKSAGALTFGPEGILFVGDSLGGAIYAVDTQDRTAGRAAPVDIKALNQKIAAMLGTQADQILVNDLAVNPISKKMYVSVARGRGTATTPVLLRIDAAGKIEELGLTNLKHSKVAFTSLPALDAPRNARGDAITDLAFVDGKLLVAGLSNEEFSSNLKSIAFPFQTAANGASIEIWHGSHGRFETNSPVRTFVPYRIGNESNILAAYTCTPLVKIPMASLQPGAKVKGTTIAELGSGNRPLDMIVYSKGGQDFILMNNNNRGVMKMPTSGLGGLPAITAPVPDMAGLKYETIATLKGVQQLDKLDDTTAVILTQVEGGTLDLSSIALP
jgi:hypothetical protein